MHSTQEKPLTFARARSLGTLLVTLLSAAAGAGAAVAVSRAKLDATVEDVASLKARVEPNARWQQHVDDRLDSVDETLKRIEDKVTK